MTSAVGGLGSPPQAKTTRGQSLRPGSSCGCWLTGFWLDGSECALRQLKHHHKVCRTVIADLLSELRAA
jgi:hypothetical protein